jgi:hypothetical protein
MTPVNAMPRSRSRVLPLFTIGLAVVGLVVSTGLVWWTREDRPRWDRWDYFQQPSQEDRRVLEEMRQILRERGLEPSPWTPKVIGGAVVTVVVLGCALYVIVSRRYRAEDKKWAYGAVGTLLGFWLGTS